MKDIEAVFEGELEPGVYEIESPTLATLATSELGRLAEEHGFSFSYVDGSKVPDGAAFLEEVAGAMDFPYFGHNYNALLDCLRDLEWIPAKGYVVLYDGFEAFAEGDPRGWEIVKDVFRTAIRFQEERLDTPMYLLLRPEGIVASNPAPIVGVHAPTSKTDDAKPATRATAAGAENRRRSLEDIKRDFLLEGLHDIVGLWQFGGHVRGALGVEDDEEVKNASLRLMRELVGEGLFVPVEFWGHGGIQPWALGPEESIRAIERLWDDLGRDPNLGDLEAPWFQVTEKGAMEGERIEREQKRYNAPGGEGGSRSMQRVDLIMGRRNNAGQNPIQLFVNRVKDQTGGGYSIAFEDEHGGEGRIIFNQNLVAAVVISPPVGVPEQDAKAASGEPGSETAGPDLGEERGVVGRDSGAEPDVDTAQELGTTREPPPQKEPPADPT